MVIFCSKNSSLANTVSGINNNLVYQDIGSCLVNGFTTNEARNNTIKMLRIKNIVIIRGMIATPANISSITNNSAILSGLPVTFAEHSGGFAHKISSPSNAIYTNAAQGSASIIYQTAGSALEASSSYVIDIIAKILV